MNDYKNDGIVLMDYIHVICECGSDMVPVIASDSEILYMCDRLEDDESNKKCSSPQINVSKKAWIKYLIENQESR